MSYECSPTGDGSGFRGCGRVFAGLRDFDRHLAIRGYVAPGTPAAFTCRLDAELRAMGLDRDERGKWADPEASVRLRAAHRRPISPTSGESGAL